MIKSKRLGWPRAVALLATVALAGAMASPCGTSGPSGMLVGKVTLGPIAPVERAGGPPNTRPYAATIDVETVAGNAVVSVASGSDGVFSVRLQAGSYRLVPRSPQGRSFPHAAPLDATVVADRTTKVTIAYDSGIR